MSMNPAKPDRVADALPDSWVYRLLPRKVWPYAQLARWDRPIGWWLLLWPCWWSLALAINLFFDDPIIGGSWTFHVLPLIGGFVAFLIGAVAMRGAGCTYNDLVDVKIDEMVARTASRPIPSGRVSREQAKLFIIVQLTVGAMVLLFLTNFRSEFNGFAFLLGISSITLALIYPFAKRFTNWPQFFLGLAFSWGALMGWAVMFGELAAAPVTLYLASILWVIGYDTIYAHQDREDDALVGVKSTARLFGEHTKPALIVLYGATLALFVGAFLQAHAGWPSYIGLALGGGQMIWQVLTLNIDDADNCLRLFKSNSHFGWIILAGLLADLVF